MFLRSERSEQSASTCNPTEVWSKMIGVLRVLCVSAELLPDLLPRWRDCESITEFSEWKGQGDTIYWIRQHSLLLPPLGAKFSVKYENSIPPLSG